MKQLQVRHQNKLAEQVKALQKKSDTVEHAQYLVTMRMIRTVYVETK